MFTHFDFLQKGDPVTKNVPGYQARLITVSYFIMREQLKSYMDGKWKMENNGTIQRVSSVQCRKFGRAQGDTR